MVDMALKPVTTTEIWTYTVRELTKYVKAVVLANRYGSDTYTKYTYLANSSQTLTGADTSYLYNVKGIFIPKTALNITNLYVLISYGLRTTVNGYAGVKLHYGSDMITVDTLGPTANPTNVYRCKFMDLTPYLKDDYLYVYLEAIGDGTNNSYAELYNIVIIAVIA